MALLLEDARSSLSRVESTVQVDLHDLPPFLISVILCCDRGYDSRVADDDVQFSEVLRDLLDGRLDGSLAGHVGLVGGCFDVICGCDLCGDAIGVFG